MAGFTAVGSLVQNNGNNVGSVALANVNSQAVGDVIVVTGQVGSTGTHISSLSHSGVTTWTKATSATTTTPFASTVEIWWGVVTSVATATLTVTLSNATGGDCEYAAQVFTPPSGTVSTDVTGTNTDGTSTVNFPTLAPTNSNELYVAYAFVAGVGVAGSTTGYTYTITAHDKCIICWNGNITASTSPTASETSGSSSFDVAALIQVTGGGGGATASGAPFTSVGHPGPRVPDNTFRQGPR